MSSNIANPFERPSPFKHLRQGNSSILPASYSSNLATTNRIMQSQVRPVMISHSSSSRNIYDGGQLVGGGIGGSGYGNRKTMIPTHDISIGGSSINDHSYNPNGIFGGMGLMKNYENSLNTISEAVSIGMNSGSTLGIKQNPFKRSSLLGSNTNSYQNFAADNSYQQYRNDGIVKQNTSTQNKSYQDNNYINSHAPNNTSYDYLRYLPSSLPRDNIQSGRHYNHDRYEELSNRDQGGLLLAPVAYSRSNYLSSNDKSDTNSVFSYINNLGEENRSLYSSNSNNNNNNNLNSGGLTDKPNTNNNLDTIYSKGSISKDYSHLEYKPNKNPNRIQTQNIAYNNQYDKYKYRYQKEKQRQQQAKINGVGYGNNQEEIGSGNSRKSSVQNYQPLSVQNIGGGGGNKVGGGDGRRNTERQGQVQVQVQQVQKTINKYQFEDYHDEQEQENYHENGRRYPNKYNKNIYSREINKYEDDKQFDFNKRESIESQLQIFQRQQNDKRYENYTQEYINSSNTNNNNNHNNNNNPKIMINEEQYLQQYHSPQFGKLASNGSNNLPKFNTNYINSSTNARQENDGRNDIVRFDDDEQEINTHGYGFRGSDAPEKQIKMQGRSGNEIKTKIENNGKNNVRNHVGSVTDTGDNLCPQRIIFRNIEYFKISLID